MNLGLFLKKVEGIPQDIEHVVGNAAHGVANMVSGGNNNAPPVAPQQSGPVRVNIAPGVAGQPDPSSPASNPFLNPPPSFNNNRNVGEKVFDQLNPFDNGRTFTNAKPKNNRSVIGQATHNMGTDIAGDLTYKPFVQAPWQAGTAMGNTITDLRTGNKLALPQDSSQILPDLAQTGPGFLPSQAVNAGSGTFKELKAGVEALKGNKPAALRDAKAGLGNLNQTVAGQLVSPAEYGIANAVHATPEQEQAIGLNPDATGAQKYIGNPIVGAAGVIGAAAGVRGGVDMIRGKGAVDPAAQAVLDHATANGHTVGDIKDNPFLNPDRTALNSGDKPDAGLLTKGQNSVQAPGEVPTESAPVREPAAPANTPFGGINKAINDMMDHYNSDAENPGFGVANIAETAKAAMRRGTKLAGGLWREINKQFDKPGREAIADYLEGIDNPDLTPEGKAVGDALKPLMARAHDVRREVDPNVGHVTDYLPRVLRGGKGSSGKSGLLGALHDIMDLGNLNSVFSRRRQVGKFVGSDGSVLFGRQRDHGIVEHKSGELSNNRSGANRVTYQRAPTTTRELEANLPIKFHHSVGRLMSIYHSDTAGLQARHAAIQELTKNPMEHGLYTKQQVESGMAVPDDIRELDIPGLRDENGEKFWASSKATKYLERDQMFGRPDSRTLAGKAYDAVASTATQFIVLNPVFHGANQLVQASIAAGNISGRGGGWIRLTSHIFSKITDDDIVEYMSHKDAAIPDYGSSLENILSKASFGATKLNSKAMAAIELRLRVALYKASIEGKMDPDAAIKNINTFMGDDHQLSKASNRVILFGHYLKTMGNAIGQQVTHPIENKGANANTAMVAALLMGTSSQYQKFLGNKNAYVRLPGELGLIKEGVKAVGEVKSGAIPSVVTNHINPVAKEVIQQSIPGGGMDLFTKQKVTDTQPIKVGGVSLGARGTHAVNSLVAPMQQVEQGASGKRSPGELAENQLGLYSPHAKGYQAAPSGKANFINTKGSIKDKYGNDPTGYQQQQNYFKGLDTLKGQFAHDKPSTDELNKYLDREVDPATGRKKENSPSDSVSNGQALFHNDKLRQSIQSFEKSQPHHDPMWDLSNSQLKTLMQYKGMHTGDDEKTVLYNRQTDSKGDNWIQDVVNKQQDYYNNLQKAPGGQAPIPDPTVSSYPKFSPATQKLLDQYDAGDAATKTQLIQDHGAELSTAWKQKAQWTNRMRAAEGALQKNDYPVADAETQAIMDQYNALPKSKSGGNTDPATMHARSNWIKANPAAYAKMQNYLAQASMNSLIDNAAMAQFKGTTPDQKLLGDIKNVGQYDLAQNPDGTLAVLGSPGVQPKAVSLNSSSSGSGSKSSATLSKFIANEKSASQARDAEHAAKASNNVVKGVKRTARLKGSKRMSIHMRGETRVRPFRVKGATLKPRSISKRPAMMNKASHSLNTRNHAKLRT